MTLFNHTAEQAVLAAILLDPPLLSQAESIVHPDDFHNPQNRRVFRAMLTVQERGGSMDIPGLVGVDDGLDVVYCASILDGFPRALSLEKWAEDIRTKSALRALQSAGDDISALTMDEPNAEEAVAKAVGIIIQVSDKARLGTGFQSSSSLASPAADRIIERSRTPDGILGLRTGLTKFDEVVGGLREGQLIIIGGRPATGKTAAAVTIADNVAEAGHRVAFFSLEMTAIDIAIRRNRKRSRASDFGLRIGKDDPERVVAAASSVIGDKLYIDEAGDQSLDLVRAKARRFALEHDGVDLIVIDYLQLLTAKEENRLQVVSAVARGLKNMAKELSVPVLALSQLNRESESAKDHRPTMAQLKESGEQEQAADIVVLLYRPWVHDRTKDPEDAEWIVAKQRDGGTEIIPVRYIDDLTTFEDAKGAF